MKRSNGARRLLGAILAAAAAACHAQEFAGVFNMESETLRPLPPMAMSAVRSHARGIGYGECALGGFVGENVDLAGHGKAMDWIAITADGCAWGTSSAVIWVLRHEGNAYRVVLQSGGHSVGLANSAGRAKLGDLKIFHLSAGHYGETQYRYIGKKYKEIKSRFVDLGDPEDCERNRDLDVCKPVP